MRFSAAREATIAAALLAGFAIAGSGVVSLIQERTAGRIAANEAAAVRERLAEIIPPESHDNDVATDTTAVIAPDRLGSDEALTVYRARRDGEPVAAALTVVAPDGYNGAIRLLVGVREDGVLTGIRVISHQETPGLGDGIEARRSDWVEQFPGRSLGDPSASEWEVRKDGGAFDQFTGATITPRAVVRAVRRALAYFRENRSAIFAAHGDGMEQINE